MTVRHSQNGYTSYDRTQVTQYTVTASGRIMTLRKGSPGLLLARAVRWFDENIRNIDPGIMDDWSYAERPIRGDDGSDPDNDSNHASGTAADVDATKWPLGVNPEAYLTADEIRRWRKHLEEYEGCLRWGGDYVGRKDPMHVEVNKNQATCDRVWAKLSQEDDMFEPGDRQKLEGVAVFTDWFGTPDDDPKTPANESQPNSKGELTKRIRGTHEGVAILIAQQGALLAAIGKLAEAGGLDAAEMQAAAKAGAQAALEELAEKIKPSA